MSKTSQRRTLDNLRKRLAHRGTTRFEVVGRDSDRDLIRSMARYLAEGGADADRLRATVRRTMSGQPPKGGIVKALLASPLVGSEIDLSCSREEGRRVDSARRRSARRLTTAV
jgi:hypothetical protein